METCDVEGRNMRSLRTDKKTSNLEADRRTSTLNIILLAITLALTTRLATLVVSRFTSGGESTKPLLATIDRIENKVAILILKDHAELPIAFPMEALPRSTSEGDILEINVYRKPDLFRAQKKELKRLLHRLQKNPRGKAHGLSPMHYPYPWRSLGIRDREARKCFKLQIFTRLHFYDML